MTYLLAEFMHQPRPADPRARAVFDSCLRSRLSQLDSRDVVVFICRESETADSLAPLTDATNAQISYAFVNPAPYEGDSTDTPRQLGWETPAAWRRYASTDRWARIAYALEFGEQFAPSLNLPVLLRNLGKPVPPRMQGGTKAVRNSPSPPAGRGLGGEGYLLLPAHDAIWSPDLLPRLTRLSQKYAKNGLPAAVSPYTYHQHSPVPDVNIDPHIIALLNTALGRDSLFWWKITTDQVQGFWGKMGMIPLAMCADLRHTLDMTTFEDDLIIDSAIRRLGYGVRALWAWSPRLYRQALPVFDRADVRAVIMRTLHYSLNVRGSRLTTPLDVIGRLRRLINPRFRRLNDEAEAIIQECAAEITARLEQFGASWVDWGAYRHVVRVGDPSVEVWKREDDLV
jgi:hypothetical protein